MRTIVLTLGIGQTVTQAFPKGEVIVAGVATGALVVTSEVAPGSSEPITIRDYLYLTSGVQLTAVRLQLEPNVNYNFTNYQGSPIGAFLFLEEGPNT